MPSSLSASSAACSSPTCAPTFPIIYHFLRGSQIPHAQLGTYSRNQMRPDWPAMARLMRIFPHAVGRNRLLGTGLQRLTQPKSVQAGCHKFGMRLCKLSMHSAQHRQQSCQYTLHVKYFGQQQWLVFCVYGLLGNAERSSDQVHAVLFTEKSSLLLISRTCFADAMIASATDPNCCLPPCLWSC